MYLLQFDWWLIIEKFILIAVIVTVALVVAMYSTYAERKIAGFLQDRLGPDRAGPFGILQPLADGLKLFMKEEIIPLTSSKFLFILGPCIAMMTAIMAGVLIPWGGTLTINGTAYSLQIADIPADRVSLRLDGRDLRDALKALFTATHVSYTISADLRGSTVTASLDNKNLRAVLETLLRTASPPTSATYRIEGGVYHIVPRK